MACSGPDGARRRRGGRARAPGRAGRPLRRREPAARRGRHVRRAEQLGLLTAGGGDRPDPRTRTPGRRARRLARGASPPRGPAPLRSRTGRTHRRMTFEEARAQFPVLERYAYLNAGTNGPLARATVDAIVEQVQRDLVEGRSNKQYFERMLELREVARRGFADVLGVEPVRIALVESTSRGCAVVLAGLGLTADDEVITTDQEHFGLTGPPYATGARVVMVEADEDAIIAAVTPRTRLIATSHVLWTTGRRLDVHRVRRESGLPLLVDGAQSSGAIEVDVGELDFYTLSAHKWICAPDPAGALYVHDPGVVRVRAPSDVSDESCTRCGGFVPRQTSAPVRGG